MKGATFGRILRLLPLLLPVGLIFLGGFALTVAQSFGVLVPVEPVGGSLHGYAALFMDSRFFASFGFTFLAALTSALASVALGTFAAYGIWRLPAFLRQPAMIYKIPLVLPHISVAFVILVLWSQSGFVASVAHGLGLIERPADFPPLLFSGNGMGLIMAYAWKGSGFVILLALAVLSRLDPRLIVTARMLGAGRIAVFWRVVMPHLSPVLHTCFIILFLYAFGAFDIPYLLGESSPGMLSVRVFNLYFKRDLALRPHAMAILVFMLLFSAVFIVFYMRGVRRLRGRERKL